MRYYEIAAPAARPYTVTVAVERARLGEFERLVRGRSDVRVLHRDDRRAAACTFLVGCSSDAVRRQIENDWR